MRSQSERRENGLGIDLPCASDAVMRISDEPTCVPTPMAALTRSALDRATLRRTFGVALLRASRTLGRLLARADGARIEEVCIDDALASIDELRDILRAMRDVAHEETP